MTLLDIIIIIPLVWALWKGCRKGIVPQVGTLVGLIVGLFVAYWLGSAVNEWLNVSSQAGKVVTFIAIVGSVILCIIIAARLISGAFNTAGLGLLDQLGGAVLSCLKTGIIISVLLCGFQWFNDKKEFVKDDTLSKSLLYYPMVRLTSYAFPYMQKAQDEIEQWGDQQPNGTEDAQRDSI